MIRRSLLVFIPVAVALGLLAACTGGSQQGGAATPTPSSTVSVAPRPTTPVSTVKSVVTTTVRSTVTRTGTGRTTTIGPPPSTAEPAAVAGDCPYLTTDWVAYTTGQHQGSTMVIATKPYPVCEFYRSGGGWAATVRIVTADTAAAAVAAVNQHVPVDGSQPASQPQGWSGGSISKGQQVADADAKSVYAVAKGKLAVIAEENESPSIKARTIAVCAIYGAKLQSGTAPDYCTVGY